jgi:hypothetical protein
MRKAKEVGIIADQYQQMCCHCLKNQHTILTALQALQTVLLFQILWTPLPVFTNNGLGRINQDHDHVLTIQCREVEASHLSRILQVQ